MAGPLTEVQEAVLLERRLSQIEHGQEAMRQSQDDGFRRVLEAIVSTQASIGILGDRVAQLEKWQDDEKAKDDFQAGQISVRNQVRKRDLAIIGGAFAGLQGLIGVVVKHLLG